MKFNIKLSDSIMRLRGLTHVTHDSVEPIVKDLCKIYDIPECPVFIYIELDNYKKINTTPHIHKKQAACYNYVAKTMHFLTLDEDKLVEIRNIFHEFYHHLDKCINGYMKWSNSTKTNQCNDKADYFAYAYIRTLLDLETIYVVQPVLELESWYNRYLGFPMQYVLFVYRCKFLRWMCW